MLPVRVVLWGGSLLAILFVRRHASGGQLCRGVWILIRLAGSDSRPIRIIAGSYVIV